MQNLLWLDTTKHAAWHTLFKNSPPEDIIEKLEYAVATLKRMVRMKGYIPREVERSPKIKVPRKVVRIEQAIEESVESEVLYTL